MHSEAKQTERQSLEQRKVYCRAKQGEWVAHAQKTPKLLKGFQQNIFKGQVREGRPRLCDQLMHSFLIG